MALSSNLISQLVKVNKEPKKASESTSYGTVVSYEGRMYVKLDGSNSDVLTPVNTTSSVKEGDRVTVLIKDHTATVTGNVSDPSASSNTVLRQSYKISEFEGIIAYKVTTDNLEVINAYIDTLRADLAKIDKLDAVRAEIDQLEAYLINTDHLTATDMKVINAQIENLEATFGKFTDVSTENLEAINAEIGRLKAYTAEFTYVSAEVLEAMRAQIKDLDVENLDAKYANIDFANIGEAAFRKIFSDSGLIRDLVVGDSTITGELVGVTIKGDLIEGNTVKADKLVVKGSDGIYYKLNFEAGSFKEGEAVPTDSIHGSIITVKSVTAEKVSVEDLVAFNATIGGFNITDHSLYSGVKENVANTTRGIYLDDEGQIAFGDSNNYVKFYADEDGTYKLEISAEKLTFGAQGTDLEEFKNTVDNLTIGGRNYILKGKGNIQAGFFAEFDTITDEYGEATLSSAGTADSVNLSSGFVLDCPEYEVGKEVVFSYDIMITKWDVPANATIRHWMMGQRYIQIAGTQTVAFSDVTAHALPRVGTDCELNEWIHVEEKLTIPEQQSALPDADACILFENLNPGITATVTIRLKNVKLEYGNKATDWTPAPEDMATAEDAENAQNSASEAQIAAGDAQSRVSVTESEIKQLAEMIASLVTDEHGSSLMTQTSGGWTFNISDIINKLDNATQDVSTLNENVNSTNSNLDTLKQAVNDLGVMASYVVITTYNGQPCIELGQNENDFKLRITNTEIQFADGTTIPAYVSNKKLMIEQAEVKNELQFGGFVWKARSNGNIGLIWKAVGN